jgi:hypothetical protein
MRQAIKSFEHGFFDPAFAAQSSKAREWDGSTAHLESAIKADNPCREENIRTIASRLARFNAMESERDALRSVLARVTRELDEIVNVTSRAIEQCKGNFGARVAPSMAAIEEARAALKE